MSWPAPEPREYKKPKGLKRTPIKKRSKKKAQQLPEDKALQEADWKCYLEIWAERPHNDYETGEPIYGQPLTLYFHHVLPKELYPLYRHCKWNIVLITWATHSSAEANLKFTPKIKALYETYIRQEREGTLPPPHSRFPSVVQLPGN